MRGRKKEPEGRRVTVSAKISESLAEALDADRADTSRSAWLEDAIRHKLAPAAQGPEIIPVKPHTLSRDKQERCTHPGTRVIGGYCRECGHIIEIGGRWRE